MLNIFGLSPIFKPPYIGTELNDYLRRVQLDSGVVASPSKVDQWIHTAKANGFFDPTQMLIAPIFGYKERISAPYSFLSKLYSLRLAANDAAQTTEVNQPYKAGYIAPNEVLAAKNPNGGARFFTHPTISFAANQAWSVTIILNNNYKHTAENQWFIGDNSVNWIFGIATGNKQYSFYKGGYNLFNSCLPEIGKNSILTLIANGSGSLSLYVNSVLNKTISVDTQIALSRFINGYTNLALNGSVYFYRIQSGAMTPSQITAEYDLLRSWIPEIESVQIGSQVWASSNLDVVATPLGNVIPEVQTAGAVEKVTNAADREFSSDTGWWTKGSGVSIADNVCKFNNVGIYAGLRKSSTLTVNKYYKITYTVLNYVSGSISFQDGMTGTTIISANGTYTQIYKAMSTLASFAANSNATTLDIDNVSVQELNWSNATEIYDAVYAATSGTAAQKHYAAVKEAAMWCSYNNDTANQSIYGKILNGYAIKLLNLDMITVDYGYRPTLQSDWDALETYLGVDAGNDVKHNGTTYWSAPNGGTNASGLTVLPGGYRNAQGAFVGLNDEVYMITADEADDRIGGYARLIKD